MTGSDKLRDWLIRRIRIKKKLIQKRPKFLLRYFLHVFAWRLALLVLFVIGNILLSLPGLDGSLAREILNFREADFLRIISRVWDSLKHLRNYVTLERLIQLVSGIGPAWRRLIDRLGDIIRRRHELLRVLKDVVWPPREAWLRLKDFIRRHRTQARWIGRAIISFVIGFILLNLVGTFLLPALAIGVITFLGIDITFVVAALIPFTINLISPQLGKLLCGLLEHCYMNWRGLRHGIKRRIQRALPEERPPRLIESDNYKG